MHRGRLSITTLMFVASGLCLSGGRPAAQAANPVAAHDVIVEPATLIFGGVRVAH